MTTRCNPIARIAAFFLLALALWIAPTGVHAQDALCVCDHYTITIDSHVTCKMEICWSVSNGGPIACRILSGGETLILPCPLYKASVRLCNNTFYTFIDNNPVGSICTDHLTISPGCCVRGCRTRDAQGCPVIDFQPVPCSSLGC